MPCRVQDLDIVVYLAPITHLSWCTGCVTESVISGSHTCVPYKQTIIPYKQAVVPYKQTVVPLQANSRTTVTMIHQDVQCVSACFSGHWC